MVKSKKKHTNTHCIYSHKIKVNEFKQIQGSHKGLMAEPHSSKNKQDCSSKIEENMNTQKP